MLDIIFLNGDKKRSEWTMVGGSEERKRISRLTYSWGNRRYVNARDHQASSTCSLAIILLKINTSGSIVPIAFQRSLLTTVSCALISSMVYTDYKAIQLVCLIMLIRPNEQSDFVYDILILNIVIIIIHVFINFVITYNRAIKGAKRSVN